MFTCHKLFNSAVFLRIATLVLALSCVGWLGLSASASAATFGAYIAEVQPAEVFPGADHFGPVEGKPAARAAYKGDKVAGYVFETSDIGYSGKPIKVMVGMDINGIITGAKVTEHHEPILLVGIPVQKLFDFVSGYVGKSVVEMTATGAKRPVVDVISGATVTAIVVDDGMLRTALQVARTRGLAGFSANAAATAKASVAPVAFAPKDWQTLLGDGSVRRLSLSQAQVDEAFRQNGVTSPDLYAEKVAPDSQFIDLYVAEVTPEIIGRNLLGDAEYKAMTQWLEPGQQAVLIAANGNYSFRGSGYVRGGIFDRIQLIQEGVSLRFTDKLYRRLGEVAGGAPEFAEIGLFKIPKDVEYDPARPWRLELLVQRALGPREKAFTSFAIDYSLPPTLVKTEAAAPASASAPAAAAAAAAAASADMDDEGSSRSAIWHGIWEKRAIDITVLLTSLGILTLIFFFQDWLVKRPVLFKRLRMSYLVFTAVWIGGYAGAQLSVVNIFTFANSLMTHFSWDFFLLEPLIFILWCATAVSLLFWGRGAYCGWLCPFGAVQEILSAIAKRLGIPQYVPKFAWHERFWAFKYIFFIALFGLSLNSVATAERFAEIEPFKTVWLLHFLRDWQFVLWAIVALGAGLFVERAYCRYICPLGAALAIPGRGRLFEWLKRRKQCGFECTKCARDCMVQSIHPNGQINPNECLYCMHCQVVYHDHDQCLPLLMKRQGRAKKPAAPAPAAPEVKEPSAV